MNRIQKRKGNDYPNSIIESIDEEIRHISSFTVFALVPYPMTLKK